MRQAFRWTFLLALLCMVACSREPLPPIAPPGTSGELVVLVRASSAEFAQNDTAGVLAFEMDLLRAFADSMKLKVRFRRVAEFNELAHLLGTEQAHLAIGSITTDWPAKVRFSVPIRKLHYLLVEHEGNKRAPGESPLAGRNLAVLPDSPAAEVARRLTRDTSAITVLSVVRARDEMQLLRQVAVGRLDLALTDELHFKFASRLYPTLHRAMELKDSTQLVWAFPPGAANDFLPDVDTFIERARGNGLIHRLLDRYLSHDHSTNDEDIAVFIARMSRVLPDLREHFFAAEKATGIDWRLVAAIAYQESHWDPLATSPTGVRGIMMLTEDTADRLKVRDRLDARQSILGGARYFAMLRDNLPDEIDEPDRTWLALASYNIGPGHMNGVLSIARSMNRDIRSWVDIKRLLPLMEKPEYAQRLKSGAPRGGEAVVMAENVRSFYDILRHFQKPLASFTGLKDRTVMAEQPDLPRFRAAPAATPMKSTTPAPRGKADANAPPSIPNTLAPQSLDDLAPEAAALVRERLHGTPQASGTSTASPPM